MLEAISSLQVNRTRGRLIAIMTVISIFNAAFWLAVLLNAVSILLVSTMAFHWMYIAANVLQSVTNLSSLIYQLGLGASLDRSGRVVAVSTGLVTLGNGLGPSLSAGLSGAFGAPFVGIFVLVLNGVALGLYGAVKLRGAERPPMSASLA